MTRESGWRFVAVEVIEGWSCLCAWSKKKGFFLKRLQGGDETEDGEKTSAGGGDHGSSTLEGSSLAGGLRGSTSARRSRGNDGSGTVAGGVGSSGSLRGHGSSGSLVNGLLSGSGGRHGGDDSLRLVLRLRSGGGAVGADGDHGRGGGLGDGAT